jgi:hypothetical protein
VILVDHAGNVQVVERNVDVDGPLSQQQAFQFTCDDVQDTVKPFYDF